MYVNYNGSYRNQGHGPKIWLNEPQCIKMCYPHNESWFDPLILALHPLYLHMQCMNQHRLLTLRYCSSFVHVGRLLKKSSSGSKSNCFSSSVCKHSRTTSVRHIHRPIRDIIHSADATNTNTSLYDAQITFAASIMQKNMLYVKTVEMQSF